MTPYHISTISIATLTLLLITYLTAAHWLQQRSAWLTHHAEVDAVYILAGVPMLKERMEAVIIWVCHYDCQPATILIPEDPTSGTLPNRRGQDVPVSQWQKERLQELLRSHPSAAHRPFGTIRTRIPSTWREIIVVPGHYHSTDGEMQALAAYLESHPACRRVALVTSRSHIRRALQRARAHIEDPCIIGVLPACPTLVDYSPGRILLEFLQILRDQVGLTHAPLLHRRWWTRRGDGE